MSFREIHIATHQNALALRWAEYVRARLGQMHPGLTVTLLSMTSHGDKPLDTPLAKVGGKDLFVKELETALPEGAVDITAHSMEDVPVDFPERLGLHTIYECEDPHDASVSNTYASLEQLPADGVVDASGLRRQAQLLAHRPDLQIHFPRGNANTRLAKLNVGEYDVIILATAGLIRLSLESHVCFSISAGDSLSVDGQGAVGIECYMADSALRILPEPSHHIGAALRVIAERVLNRRLNGSYQVPITCYAIREDGQLWPHGLVGQPDGIQSLHAKGRVSLVEAETLGVRVAGNLLEQGAGTILEAVYGETEHP